MWSPLALYTRAHLFWRAHGISRLPCSLPLTCLPRNLIMTARKFSPNQTAFQAHLCIPKTPARMLRSTTHVLLYSGEVMERNPFCPTIRSMILLLHKRMIWALSCHVSYPGFLRGLRASSPLISRIKDLRSIWDTTAISFNKTLFVFFSLARQ